MWEDIVGNKATKVHFYIREKLARRKKGDKESPTPKNVFHSPPITKRGKQTSQLEKGANKPNKLELCVKTSSAKIVCPNI